MVRLDVGDMVAYNPSGSLRFRIPEDDEEFHTGIVIKKVKYHDDRKTNYEVLWDDSPKIYGFYREELKLLHKAVRK